MKRVTFAAALLAAGLVACGGSAKLSDAQRVWCGARTLAVVSAGTSLGIAPSRFVQYKAELEQANQDGNQALVVSLILQGVGRQVTGPDPDPHPDLKSMQSWEADAPADFVRACVAAEAAK